MPTYRNDGAEILVFHGESFEPGEDQTIGWYVDHADLTLVSDWPPAVVLEEYDPTNVKITGGSINNIDDPVDEHGSGDQGFNDARYAMRDLSATTITDPALNAAVTTAIIDNYGGVIITLTGAGNAQTLQNPTDTSKIKRFVVVTNDTNGANTIEVNGITMSAEEAQRFLWDGSAWVAVTAVDADDIAFTPTGDLVATNIQLLGTELDTEKEPRTDRVSIIHVGKHGNDSRDGLTPADAKLTFAGARAAIVAAGNAAADYRYVIWCDDAGIYAEDLVGLAYVDLWVPRATINPTDTHTMVDDIAWRIGRVTVPTAKVGFTKSAGSGTARIRLSYLDCEGTGAGFLCTSGNITMDLRHIGVVNGYGIGATGTTGQLDGRITNLVISGTGIGIGTNSAGSVINIRIGNLEDGGSGTGIYIGNVASIVNVLASRISCGTAWNVLVAGTLNIVCPSVTGTKTEAGTVNKVLADVVTKMSNFFIATALDTASVLVTASGGTITLSFEKSGTGDVNIFFSDGVSTIVCTPTAATIELTAGADDTDPQMNYVYIPQSTKVLTKSTDGFPSAEHFPVGEILCQSANSLETYGAYKVHPWNDHIWTELNNGHLSHINRWIRCQNATWCFGVALTATITVQGAEEDNINIATTEGEVLRIHSFTFPAFNTAVASSAYIVNKSGAAFTRITDFRDADEDDAGNAIGNREYINLVIWGVQSQVAGDCKLFVNLPSDFHATSDGATKDSEKYSNYNIPTDFRGTGFLIARLILYYETADSGTWTEIENLDLRGQFPSTFAGGTAAVSTEFYDSTFKLLDESDATKILQFQLSGLTTGNTRVLVIPDAAGTIIISGQPFNMADALLTRPEIKDYSETKTASSSASNVLTLDVVNGNVFSTLLTENVTTLNFNNPSPTGKACSFTWVMTQHSAAVTVTWPVTVKWDSGTAPTITANNGIYVFTFVTYDEGTTWLGFFAGSDMSVPA